MPRNMGHMRRLEDGGAAPRLAYDVVNAIARAAHYYGLVIPHRATYFIYMRLNIHSASLETLLSHHARARAFQLSSLRFTALISILSILILLQCRLSRLSMPLATPYLAL